MAQDVWYYAVDDRTEGPVTRAALDRLWDSGRIGPGTLVWGDGMADWAEARTQFGGRPVPPPRPGTARAEDAPLPSRDRAVRSDRSAYDEPVGLVLAMRRGIDRYADFTGRSNRGEFWFWTLGTILVSLGLAAIDLALFGRADVSVLSGLWCLATLIPTLAIGARRLHDTGRSGWWQLIAVVPLVGGILLIVWLAQRPDLSPNRYG